MPARTDPAVAFGARLRLSPPRSAKCTSPFRRCRSPPRSSAGKVRCALARAGGSRRTRKTARSRRTTPSRYCHAAAACGRMFIHTLHGVHGRQSAPWSGRRDRKARGQPASIGGCDREAESLTASATLSALPNSTDSGAVPLTLTVRPALPRPKKSRTPDASAISVQQSPEYVTASRTSVPAGPGGGGGGSETSPSGSVEISAGASVAAASGGVVSPRKPAPAGPLGLALRAVIGGVDGVGDDSVGRRREAHAPAVPGCDRRSRRLLPDEPPGRRRRSAREQQYREPAAKIDFAGLRAHAGDERRQADRPVQRVIVGQHVPDGHADELRVLAQVALANTGAPSTSKSLRSSARTL